jgi:HTH-type transcriptional regulator/antitoxin HipB
MTYASEEIINAVKKGREAKGLSQRELSARTGVPQSHISKIESGNADIRLSSLTELARALDLEVKLVPRKALATVESVVRSTAPSVPATETYRSAVKELQR